MLEDDWYRKGHVNCDLANFLCHVCCNVGYLNFVTYLILGSAREDVRNQLIENCV